MNSIFNQTSQSYQVIFSCNSFPYTSNSERLKIIEEDHPIPSIPADGMKDKFRKIHRALIELRGMSPCYVMNVDADDLVHRSLVEYVVSRKAEGFLINKGFMYAEGRRWFQTQNEFDKICGTSNILYADSVNLPDSMEEDPRKYEILSCGHSIFREFHRNQGKLIENIPFRAVTYITATGENHSGIDIANVRSRRKQLKTFLNRRFLNRRFIEDFTLYPIGHYTQMVQQGNSPNCLPLHFKQ